NFKYIKSLSVGGTDPELTTMHLDLKYRFTPGLWNKDESVGAILGYQDLEYRGMASPQTGVGLFWARKMPKIFDDVLNLFSFLRYPKWVDMEGIYYFNSMNSKTQLHGPNYIVTFHGKMFLKPVLFMEGSIGLRGFAITDKSAGRKSNVNMMFTTIGLGLNF